MRVNIQDGIVCRQNAKGKRIEEEIRREEKINAKIDPIVVLPDLCQINSYYTHAYTHTNYVQI